MKNSILNYQYKVITDFKIALDSPDHLRPYGTKRDNHTNKKYIEEVENYFGLRKIKYLDLGCAGGQLAVDFHLNGHIAIGLEGSDYGIKNSFANWPVYNEKVLFTCDIRKPFKIVEENGLQVLFDCISSWEFLEHIGKQDLNQVFKNVVSHLTPNGIFLGSLSMFIHPPYHATIMTEEQWKNEFFLKYFKTSEPYPFRGKVRNLHQSLFYFLKNPISI